jgi:hypothetical protein
MHFGAKFNLTAPAHVQKANQLIHVRRDEHARLECNASGERPMKIEWLRQLDDGSYSALFDRNLMPVSSDLEPLASSRRSALVRPDPDHSNNTRFVLQIASVQMQDSGSYLCKVTNDFGEDSGRLRLVVQGTTII